jgi:hypothetical protein
MDFYGGGSGGAHPHFVDIPDPARVAGVRAYREPEQPHPLQLRFLEADGERAWVEELRGLLAAGQTTAADARLSAELQGLGGSLAELCRGTPADAVALSGWEDLLPVLAEWEGPPITAITLGLTNPPDLVFEAGRAHQPELLLGLYSDDAHPFSTAEPDALLAECAAEAPAWIGHEEDVEFYCEVTGLAELNSALIGCKHRHFLRDGRDGVGGRAPGGYVEYVLGCWLRTIRFLQAVEAAVAAHGLPPGCRLIVGAVEMNADLVAVLGSGGRSSRGRRPAKSEPSFATLRVKPWTPRAEPVAATAAAGPSLRQRLQTAPSSEIAPPPPQPRRSLLARLFRRSRT